MLKSRSLIAAGALALVAVTACHDTPTEISAKGVDPRLLETVKRLGFRTDGATDFGEYVSVEGDILLRKSDLRAWAGRSGGMRSPDSLRIRPQWRTATSVNPLPDLTFRVDLSPISSNPVWLQGARQALAAWSGVTRAEIVLVEGQPADISIAFGPCPPGTIACSVVSPTDTRPGFPQGGRPNGFINLVLQTPDNDNATQKQTIIMHELGHTLGLRHSDWQSNGEPQDGAALLPGTNETDGLSVMNHNIGGLERNFSHFDTLAIRDLFPYHVKITGTSLSPDLFVTWSAAPEAVSYDIWMQRLYWQQDQGGNFYLSPEFGVVGATSATSLHTQLTDTGNGEWCQASIWVYAVYSDGSKSYQGVADAGPICDQPPF